ncbi:MULTISPECIES: zinc ribbon domain-containing protein [Methanobrevibacter]|nr:MULTISPECIES: zinc ribbon domain-containing protein [Methanobrevibacter]OEC97275.1 hypothetical protein A9505_05525 [Methanobrevibacter sp. A27]RPF51988.1 hypothetical protein EDC42_1332 [Methanobrevibacter gottschalkii DSM 11977]
MSEKICSNCGNKVDGSANFCPKCKSQSFRNINEVAKPKSGVVHKLFYKYQGGYFAVSKSKIAAITTFILFASLGFESPNLIISSVIIAFLVYIIGFAIRRINIINQNSKMFFRNNNLGLITDLMHLFAFWQDRETGKFALSKTKLISILIFFVFATSGLSLPNATPILAAVFGLIFALPVFVVGYGIHRLTTSRPVKKIVKQAEPDTGKKHDDASNAKKDIHIHEFDKYRAKLNELKVRYEIKEKNARNLIAKRFTPPQLTYDKFIASVDKSTMMFNSHAEVISNILDLASQDSKKIDDELNDRFDILEALVEKIDELIDELVLSLNDDEKEGNPSNLLNDLDDLIDSVKNY